MLNGSRDGTGWMLALAAVLAAVIFVYPLSLGIPLLDPDEGLHASIAQEMVERGDWVVPSLLGKPFLDKPIFYFWAEALSLRTFGMNEAAVRLGPAPNNMSMSQGPTAFALRSLRLFAPSFCIARPDSCRPLLSQDTPFPAGRRPTYRPFACL